jgi:hypothetical protein
MLLSRYDVRRRFNSGSLPKSDVIYFTPLSAIREPLTLEQGPY